MKLLIIHTLYALLSFTLVLILSLSHWVDAKEPPQEKKAKPWLTLSWSALHHDVSSNDEGQLRSEWEKWRGLHLLLNKNIASRSPLVKLKQKAFINEGIRELCENWNTYRLFLDLNPGLSNHVLSKRNQLCPKLNQFIENYEQAEISLLFISASLRSPASAFGHLLLSIELPLDDKQVLVRALTFSFSVPYVSGLNHGLKLLFSSEQGLYRLDSFNKVTLHYLNVEDRSIWKYPLVLSKIEKERLLTELWSLVQLSSSVSQSSKERPLGGNRSKNNASIISPQLITSEGSRRDNRRTRYSFSNSNCASKLAILLANATRQFKIYQEFDWPNAPQELLQSLNDLNLLYPARFLPSMSDRLSALSTLKSNPKQFFTDRIRSDHQENLLKQRLNDEYRLVELYRTSNQDPQTHMQSDSPSKRLQTQGILLRRIAQNQINTDLLSKLKSGKLHALGQSPSPESSLAYAQLTLGLDTQIQAKSEQIQHVKQMYFRWRGQSFSDQSTPYALSQHAWTLGALKLWYDSSMGAKSEQNLSHSVDTLLARSSSQLTLLEYKQRALSEEDSWTWNMLLAYHRSPQIHLAVGHTFTNNLRLHRVNLEQSAHMDPLSSSRSSSNFLDQSRIFHWLNPNNKGDSNQPFPGLKSSWQTSVLLGLNYDEWCEISRCSSPIQLQALVHTLSNILSLREVLILIDVESKISLGLHDEYPWLRLKNYRESFTQSPVFSSLSQKHSLNVQFRYFGQNYHFLKPYTLNLLSTYYADIFSLNKDVNIFTFKVSVSFNY